MNPGDDDESPPVPQLPNTGTGSAPAADPERPVTLAALLAAALLTGGLGLRPRRRAR